MVCRTLLALCTTVSLTLHKLVSRTLCFLYLDSQTSLRTTFLKAVVVIVVTVIVVIVIVIVVIVIVKIFCLFYTSSDFY